MAKIKVWRQVRGTGILCGRSLCSKDSWKGSNLCKRHYKRWRWWKKLWKRMRKPTKFAKKQRKIVINNEIRFQTYCCGLWMDENQPTTTEPTTSTR